MSKLWLALAWAALLLVAIGALSLRVHTRCYGAHNNDCTTELVAW